MNGSSHMTECGFAAFVTWNPPPASASLRSPHERGAPLSESPFKSRPLRLSGHHNQIKVFIRSAKSQGLPVEQAHGKRVGLPTGVGGCNCLAERVGFEPTIQFPVYGTSNAAPSAARPPLHTWPLRRSSIVEIRLRCYPVGQITRPPGRVKHGMAERVGFEPTVPYGTTVFETARIGHSRTSPASLGTSPGFALCLRLLKNCCRRSRLADSRTPPRTSMR